MNSYHKKLDCLIRSLTEIKQFFFTSRETAILKRVWYDKPKGVADL